MPGTLGFPHWPKSSSALTRSQALAQPQPPGSRPRLRPPSAQAVREGHPSFWGKEPQVPPQRGALAPTCQPTGQWEM